MAEQDACIERGTCKNRACEWYAIAAMEMSSSSPQYFDHCCIGVKKTFGKKSVLVNLLMQEFTNRGATQQTAYSRTADHCSVLHIA